MHARQLAVLVTCGCLALAGLTSSALADVINWDGDYLNPPNDPDGYFDDAANWDPDGVPGSSDTARFPTSIPYPITYEVYFDFSQPSITNWSCLFMGETASFIGQGRSRRWELTQNFEVHGGALALDHMLVNIGNELYVTGNGALTIDDSEVSSLAGLITGTAFSHDPRVTVTGADSSWSNTGDLVVGECFQGGLNISGGATASCVNAFLGKQLIPMEDPPYGDGSVLVEGTDTTWEISDSLYLGGSASNPAGVGTLTVDDGATVDVADLLKIWSGWVPSTVNLDGGTLIADTLIRAPDAFFNTAAGSTLRVNTLAGFGDTPHFHGNLQFGHSGGSASYSVETSEQLTVDEDLAVGYDASGTLVIAGGGDVESWSANIARHGGASGQVTVMGAGSSWTNSDVMYVGREDAGALSVTGGGDVYGYKLKVGYDGPGAVTVEGAGSSIVQSSSVVIGDHVQGTCDVLAGAELYSGGTFIAYASGSTGEVTVTGDSSRLINNGILTVGRRGTGTLEIADRGIVETMLAGRIGYASGSDGTVTVGGTDAAFTLWGNESALYVGGHDTAAGGTGNLTVTDGGEVFVTNDVQVWGPGTVDLQGGLLIADGVTRESGSTFESEAGSTLRVNGLAGFGDTLAFGGKLQLGHSRGSGTGSLTMDASEQTMTVIDDLTVGYNAPGELWVGSGATVSSRDGILGEAITFNEPAPDVGDGLVTVVDYGSAWSARSMFIGKDGTGELRVRRGALVDVSNFGYIGPYPDSEGTVSVTQDGATLYVDRSLYVGGVHDGSGGDGVLTIDDHGTVEVAETLKIWQPGGLVELLGGTLIADTIDGNDNFDFSGGTLHVNTFVGDLLNHGCTVAPGRSPGTTSVTRDFSQTAGILEMEIAGPAESEFDRLIVARYAYLGGALRVHLLDDYEPEYEDTFTIVSAQQVIDIFPNAPVRVYAYPRHTGRVVVGGGFFDVTYNATTVVLSHYEPAPGFPATTHENTTGEDDLTFTGAPDGVFAGIGGQRVAYDFGDLPVLDHSGPDFNVYEVAIGGPEFDKIDVLVSADGVDYVSVKSSEGVVVRIHGDEAHEDDSFARSYDLAGSGLSEARYIRIEGEGDDPAGGTQGFDLDAVGVIHRHPVGDLNCDGVVNLFDIDPFVLALVSNQNPDDYYEQFPYCDIMLADVNGDGTVNLFDVDPLTELLTDK